MHNPKQLSLFKLSSSAMPTTESSAPSTLVDKRPRTRNSSSVMCFSASTRTVTPLQFGRRSICLSES
ncbi:hypothetical protein C356_04197 [Cryptococcus neoformans c45]|nr:hypothetical protein C356_04197 [Cryptococcus neoformans var. grubii c45]